MSALLRALRGWLVLGPWRRIQRRRTWRRAARRFSAPPPARPRRRASFERSKPEPCWCGSPTYFDEKGIRRCHRSRMPCIVRTPQGFEMMGCQPRASKVPYSPEEQVKWGMRYIRERYGSNPRWPR